MESQPAVEQLRDEQVLATFLTGEAPGARGFDAAGQARVFAYELVRSRGRLALLRALYADFVATGKPYMVENLDEPEAGAAVPAKLVFTDDAAEAHSLRQNPRVTVWTEPALLEALARERAVLDFFTRLLDEYRPAVATP